VPEGSKRRASCAASVTSRTRAAWRCISAVMRVRDVASWVGNWVAMPCGRGACHGGMFGTEIGVLKNGVGGGVEVSSYGLWGFVALGL
jgi:hypothetical protein